MKKTETIILGGGCFWCVEAVFDRVKGVESAISGYAGGIVADPSYEKVSSGKTGHAEVTQITFNPEVISLEDVLYIFFTVHDPTTLNRQGNDVGTQYRSIILYSDDSQKSISEKVIAEVESEKIYTGKVITELKPLEKFYPGEEYHQHYFEKNPDAAYCQIVIAPKVSKFRQKFQKFYK
jgi:peptide-methionine (S)-S-oxide reductase